MLRVLPTHRIALVAAILLAAACGTRLQRMIPGSDRMGPETIRDQVVREVLTGCPKKDEKPSEANAKDEDRCRLTGDSARDPSSRPGTPTQKRP